MGLFDKFKKDAPAASKPVKKKADKAVLAKTSALTEKIQIKKAMVKKEFSQAAYQWLKKPLITEKALALTERVNQYVFQVAPSANKNEIKKAIQELYGVRVARVNISKVPGKKRRVGGHEGFRPGFKKAIVTLPAEEKIEIISR
ncbi:MAG: 50S ribosomal protein L23 [Patescibacteria group bacterium]